ncbi:MBL fold metallo-hydrolase [Gynurincola endophyticus]|uniref:MBL fold metallo-hydrolase n=1 Tax=Gynurincola endophyticus TaxID=2479004 RepID=UPI001F39A6EB|nr:MBL fold metallo-hydrolase [Gynurincola endophyticus]
MPPIHITFLGTGTSSGVPMVACDCDVCQSTDPKDNRLRSSVLIESATTTIVIDTGPDFRYQLLRQKVKKLDAVVFTHPHKDHIAGLDEVRAFNFFQQKPMYVYANELTQEGIIREFPYAFYETRYPGVPEIKMFTIQNDTFQVGDLTITPIQVWHLKMPVLGFRIGNFTYITDANRIDAEELEKIKGSEVLVLNTLRQSPHISHFSLEEGIQLVQTLQIPQAYFTHISHQMGKHADVNPTLPDGIELAYDGLNFTV